MKKYLEKIDRINEFMRTASIESIIEKNDEIDRDINEIREYMAQARQELVKLSQKMNAADFDINDHVTRQELQDKIKQINGEFRELLIKIKDYENIVSQRTKIKSIETAQPYSVNSDQISNN